MTAASRILAWLRSHVRGSDRLTVVLWATVLGAIVVRSIPGWVYPAWGNDYGIYFGITQDFIDHPQFFRPFSGWGTSYPYFPVLYAMTAAVHGLTGLDLDFLMPRVAPVFGGLTVLLLYLIIKELFGNRAVALAAAALLAANPFQIYQTSHAAPLTMGHFFMCLSVLFFLLQRRDRFWTGPLYLSTILLIGSHHLTTYFYILFLFAALVYRNLESKDWTPLLKEELFYLLATVTLTFCYWILIATPVFKGDFASALPIGSWTTVGLFYILIAAVFCAIPFIRNSTLFQKFRAWKLSWPTPKEDALKIGVTAGICVSLSAYFTFKPIYGDNFILLPAATLFLLPLFIIMGLSVAGYRYLDRFPERGYAKAWLLSILASFLFAIVTQNHAIYSFRHLEYFAYPLSILGGVAVWETWNYLGKGTGDQVRGTGSRTTTNGTPRNVFTAAIVALMIASGATAYAVQSTTSQYEESISPEVMDVADWMGDNVQTDLTVASDHRVSQMLWTKGFKVTSDDAYWIFFAPNWTGALGELNGTNKTYGKVGFVVIDDVMKEKGVQSNLNETPRPITDEEYAKFSSEPFELLYRAASDDGAKWAEAYAVNWTYIDDAIG